MCLTLNCKPDVLYYFSNYFSLICIIKYNKKKTLEWIYKIKAINLVIPCKKTYCKF